MQVLVRCRATPTCLTSCNPDSDQNHSQLSCLFLICSWRLLSHPHQLDQLAAALDVRGGREVSYQMTCPSLFLSLSLSYSNETNGRHPAWARPCCCKRMAVYAGLSRLTTGSGRGGAVCVATPMCHLPLPPMCRFLPHAPACLTCPMPECTACKSAAHDS